MYGLPKSVIIKTKKELLELHKRCIVSYLTSRGLKHSKQKQFFKVYDVYVSYKNIDNYFLFIKQKIESFNFNEALKQQILKDISLCSYEGLHVLKIEIKSVGEVCHFENRYYIRQGTATHLITDGEAISSLHRLYYS